MLSTLLQRFCNEILGICRVLVLKKKKVQESVHEKRILFKEICSSSLMGCIPFWSAGCFFFSCMAILDVEKKDVIMHFVFLIHMLVSL